MANTKSAIKRIRSNKGKTDRNKYQHKTTRNAVRDLRATTDKAAAEALLPSVIGMLSKLAKNNIIHANKAFRPDPPERLNDLLDWAGKLIDSVYETDSEFADRAREIKAVLNIESF